MSQVSAVPGNMYVRPDIFQVVRPDLIPQGLQGKELLMDRNIHGPVSSHQETIVYTIGVIVISAFIFITLISWADVLRSLFDSKYIDPILSARIRSTLYYAITVTIISVILVAILVLMWLYYKSY